MLEFLAKPFVAPALAALAIVSVVGNGYQYIRDGIVIRGLRGDVSHLTSERDRLKLDNATLRANQATLQSSITTQNAAVDGLKSAADIAAAQAKASQANFNAAADAIDAQASAIAKLPPLPAGADRCAAASALIRNTLAQEHGK